MIRQILLVLACVSFIYSCSENKEKRRNNKKEFPVYTLTSRDTFLEKAYVANIRAVRNVDVRNKVSGYLEKIHVDEGQLVKKDQLLFSINPQEYQAEVAQAEAMLSNSKAEAKAAEVQLERVKLLVEKNIIAKTELELANANVNAQRARIRQAQSMLDNSKTKLSYAFIRAPFDGIIDRIPFREGSLVSEGSLLTTVSDISSVFAYFNIAESEFLKYLREKNKSPENGNDVVRLILADGSKYLHKGLIETTTSEFEQGTGSIAFRAKFPNPGRMLRHGSTGEVRLSSLMEDALLLPQKSVFEIQDKNYVFLLGEADKVVMTSFVPHSRLDEYYVVKSGLKEGDRVVYEGTQSLKNGMEIIPKEQPVATLK